MSSGFLLIRVVFSIYPSPQGLPAPRAPFLLLFLSVWGEVCLHGSPGLTSPSVQARTVASVGPSVSRVLLQTLEDSLQPKQKEPPRREAPAPQQPTMNTDSPSFVTRVPPGPAAEQSGGRSEIHAALLSVRTHGVTDGHSPSNPLPEPGAEGRDASSITR